jgi:hypothetical protein
MLQAADTQDASPAVSSDDVQIHVVFVREPQYSGTRVPRQTNYNPSISKVMIKKANMIFMAYGTLRDGHCSLRGS